MRTKQNKKIAATLAVLAVSASLCLAMPRAIAAETVTKRSFIGADATLPAGTTYTVSGTEQFGGAMNINAAVTGSDITFLHCDILRSASSAAAQAGGSAFCVSAGKTASMTDVAFIGNRTVLTDAAGRALGTAAGAVRNEGTLTLTDSSFTENSAVGATAKGGAIVNNGVLNLAGSNVFQNNTVTGTVSAGGAIYNSGTVNLQGSVTLKTATDTFENRGTLNWELSGLTGPGDSVRLDGFDRLTNLGGSLVITLRADQPKGDYLLATGVGEDMTGKTVFTVRIGSGAGVALTVGGGIVSVDGTPYRLELQGSELHLVSAVDYTLYLKDGRIYKNSEAAMNALDAEGLTFDKDTGIWTAQSFSFATTRPVALILADEDTTLVLEGKNELLSLADTAEKTDSYGLQVSGSLTLVGRGSLTVTAGSTNGTVAGYSGAAPTGDFIVKNSENIALTYDSGKQYYRLKKVPAAGVTFGHSALSARFVTGEAVHYFETVADVFADPAMATVPTGKPVTVTLLDDITENITVPTGVYCVLDLADRGITAAGAGSVLTVSPGATLALQDTVENGTRHIWVANEDGLWQRKDGLDTAALCENTDYFTTVGGFVTGGTGTESSLEEGKRCGGGIYAVGDVKLWGGSVVGNTADRGGGIYMAMGESPSLNMEGTPAVVGNVSAGAGAGVALGCDGSIFMRGGCISYNTVTGAMGGGGVYCRGNMYLFDGEISHNKAQNGAGVYVQYDDITSPPLVLSSNIDVYGGRISDNIATESGGGIYLADNCNFVMTGGVLTGNAALGRAKTGGGVMCCNSTYLDGSPYLWGNADADGNPNNLYLATTGGHTARVLSYDGGVLGQDARIGVLTDGEAISLLTDAKQQYADCFVPDNGYYQISFDDRGDGEAVNDEIRLEKSRYIVIEGTQPFTLCIPQRMLDPEGKELGTAPWNAGVLQYSPDGTSWKSVAIAEEGGVTVTAEQVDDATAVQLCCIESGEGKTVYLRGRTDGVTGDDFYAWRIETQNNGTVSMRGNMMALLNCIEPFEAELTEGAFAGMFRDWTVLTEAPELPAMQLAEDCYAGLFAGCTGLVRTPELPATVPVDGAYDGMFRGCTGLREVAKIDLAAAESKTLRLQGIFENCCQLVVREVTDPAEANLLLPEYEGEALSLFAGTVNGCLGKSGGLYRVEGYDPTDDSLAVAEANGEKYPTVQQAVNAAAAADAKNAGTVRLLQDCTLTAAVQIAPDSFVRLDLAGNMLMLDPATPGEVALLQNEGSLTLFDSAPNAVHTGTYAAMPSGGILTGGSFGGIRNTGTLTVLGGTVTGNTLTEGFGAGIYNAGQLTVGGTAAVTGNYAVTDGRVIREDTAVTDGTPVSRVETNLYSTGTVTVADGADAPRTGMRIGVTLLNEQQTAQTGVGTVADNATQGQQSYFINDDATRTVLFAAEQGSASDEEAAVGRLVGGEYTLTPVDGKSSAFRFAREDLTARDAVTVASRLLPGEKLTVQTYVVYGISVEDAADYLVVRANPDSGWAAVGAFSLQELAYFRTNMAMDVYVIGEVRQDTCEYVADFGAAENVLLVLGAKQAAGRYTVAAVQDGYTLYDISAKKYIACEDGEVIRQGQPFTWQFDGGIYVNDAAARVGLFGRESRAGSRRELASRRYLALEAGELTVQTGFTAAGIKFSTNRHSYIYSYQNASQHVASCTNCGTVTTEEHQYNRKTHSCECGGHDPAAGAANSGKAKK